MYDILVERGASKGDCVHKIVKKYGIHFLILKEKTIPSKLGGLIPEKYELEYCLTSLKSFTGGVSGDTYPQTASPEREPRLTTREWSGPAEGSGRQARDDFLLAVRSACALFNQYFVHFRLFSTVNSDNAYGLGDNIRCNFGNGQHRQIGKFPVG